MVQRCIVRGCRSEWYPACNVIFHKFPSDTIQRKKWLSTIPLKQPFSESAKICSLHFKDTDYDKSGKRLLIGVTPFYEECTVSLTYDEEQTVAKTEQPSLNGDYRFFAHQLAPLLTEVQSIILNRNTTEAFDISVTSRYTSASSGEFIRDSPHYDEMGNMPSSSHQAPLPLRDTTNQTENIPPCKKPRLLEILDTPLQGEKKSIQFPTEESSHLTERPDDEDEIEMIGSSDELMACRACLAVDGRLYSISGSGLEDALATFAGIAMPEAECLPQHLCVFCRAVLAKCVAFRDRCQRSTALLEALLEKGPLKMNDITAIDRDEHKLSNNLIWIKVLQFGTDPLIEVMSLIKTETENNKNSDEETECIEAEYLDSNVSENNDANDEFDSSFELPNKKKKKRKSGKVQLRKRKRTEVKKDKTEYDDLQLETDDMEINGKSDASDVDTETSKETRSVRKKNELWKTKRIETKIATKKKKPYKLPPSIDIKAFEEKYNFEYKFLNEEEQKQEIEERKANNVMRYCCDMCGTGYRREHSMVNHLWIHDPRQGPYECGVCRKRSRSSRDMRQHRFAHRDRYTCRECGLVSRSSYRAKTHYKEHQGRSYVCPYCSEVYVLKTSYYNHIRTTHPERNEACDECGETFLSAAGVRQHKALAHRPGLKEILKCKDCDVEFSSAEALQRHCELGAGVPHAALWACAACGDSCGSETARANHAAERHPPERLHCDECNKTFANAASFSLHEARKHFGVRASVAPFRRVKMTVQRRTPGTGSRGPGPRRKPGTGPHAPQPFVCEICGRILKSAMGLTNHRNVHLGIKPYSCPVCDKKFTYKISLRSHIAVHTGERRHRCEHCPQMFSQKSNLQKHITNVHYRIRATCQICGKSMGVASLYEHVRSMHLNAGQPRTKRDRKNEKKRKPVQFDHSYVEEVEIS